jgi:DNA-binding MarR family transcriptional regulator
VIPATNDVIQALIVADREGLTPTELRAVRVLWAVHGLSTRGTTPDELGIALGLPKSVAVLLTALSRKGYIRHPGQAGGPIVLLRDEHGRTLPVPADN